MSQEAKARVVSMLWILLWYAVVGALCVRRQPDYASEILIVHSGTSILLMTFNLFALLVLLEQEERETQRNFAMSVAQARLDLLRLQAYDADENYPKKHDSFSAEWDTDGYG